MQDFNYHTHTYRCGHAEDYMEDEDYVKEFIEKGFRKIAFTDHAPQKKTIDKRSNMRMEYSEMEGYLESIKRLKEKYKDKIEIETGFEIEYLPGEEANLFELKDLADKIVLGQHFIYDDEEELKIFRKNKFSDDDLIRYAEYIKTAMELKIPDIIVHPDLYMLSRSEFDETCKKVAEIICEAAQKNDVILEINLTEAFLYSVNLRSKIRYPCKEFWEVASKFNIKVIYGIDAHYREQIRNYEKSIEVVNNLIGEEIIGKLNFVVK